MNNERLGALVGAALATHEVIDPLAVGACLTDQELAAIAEARGMQVASVAPEAGATALTGEATLVATETITVPEIDHETNAKFETLSPYFREVVKSRYAHFSR